MAKSENVLSRALSNVGQLFGVGVVTEKEAMDELHDAVWRLPLPGPSDPFLAGAKMDGPHFYGPPVLGPGEEVLVVRDLPDYAALSGSVSQMLPPQFVARSGSALHDGLHVMTQPQWRQVTPSEDLLDAIMDKLYGGHCAKAVVKCEHCGQWAARFCACKQCGAPVD